MGAVERAKGARSKAFEAGFFKDAATLHQLQAGAGYRPNPAFWRTVTERLTAGESYGDRFMRIDNLREAIEEGPDIAAYSVLEATRLLAQDLEEDRFIPVRAHLVGACVYAVQADQEVRSAMHERDK